MPRDNAEEKKPPDPKPPDPKPPKPAHPKRTHKRVVISKSRYKIYDDPPRQSVFAESLANIKRQRESLLVPGIQDEQIPGPSRRRVLPTPSSLVIDHHDMEHSTTRLVKKKSVNIMEAYRDYLRRQEKRPRRIKIFKIYAGQ
ncbi:uncharacterized protein LOC129757010 isoform X2 [Uranotaenia lowii]|uniref:uncharacterized protein LOC129757010 isoform X2 n=1 Tax=Uranotaenia lowii TaxID=190385 RepID=UPI002478C342|nr:uncharacterized protein LOC129757010 isoform X2 [Uranotaenia lowii]